MFPKTENNEIAQSMAHHGKIPTIGASITNRAMDAQTHRKIMLLAHILNMSGSHVISLDKFCPVV